VSEAKQETLDRLARLQLARKIKQAEADYRREKRWKIFSWTSSLLVGSIAGAVAITSSSNTALPLWPHKLVLILAVLTLAAYAILWIRYNGIVLENAWNHVRELDAKLGVYGDLSTEDTDPRQTLPFISYGMTIGLLAAAAIAIILLS
jgi:uncharacterized protein (DUF983 family)